MVIKRAVLLILINKEEERLMSHPNLHHIIVSGKDEKTSYIPSLCKNVALAYLEKHPEYRLAYHESWEYLAYNLTIDEERKEDNHE